MNTTSTPAIGICGGGNLAHAMAGWLGTRGLHVNILTRNPNQWGKSLSTIFPNGTTHHAPLGHISNHPEILKDCNLVLVAVPRFGIRIESRGSLLYPVLRRSWRWQKIPLGLPPSA